MTEELLFTWIPELFFGIWLIFMIIGEYLIFREYHENYWEFVKVNFILVFVSLSATCLAYIIVRGLIALVEYNLNILLYGVGTVITFLLLKYVLWMLYSVKGGK